MNILLSTDGLAHTENAVEFALDYARLKDATLFIVFVASPREDEERVKVEKCGRSALARLESQGAKLGVRIKTLLEVGNPYETILDIADRVRADIIVVGTSGKTAVDRMLIGSVSEYIVRNAKCTVVVVRR